MRAIASSNQIAIYTRTKHVSYYYTLLEQSGRAMSMYTTVRMGEDGARANEARQGARSARAERLHVRDAVMG